MKRLEGLTARLIQAASHPMLPVEALSSDLQFFKRLETWESRVSASRGHSYIWTRIPRSLKALSGSTNPVRGIIRAHFPFRILDTGLFFFPSAEAMWQDMTSLYKPSGFFHVEPPARKRGFLSGVLGRIFG